MLSRAVGARCPWLREARALRDKGRSMAVLRKAVVDEKGKETTPLDFVLRVAAGRFDDSPFDEALMEQARLVVAGHLGGGS